MRTKLPLGGFGPIDGTIEFYGRVNALLRPEHVVLDLGAGRAWWYEEDLSPYRRALRVLKGKVAKVYGADVDTAVLQNMATDENRLISDQKLPFSDSSIDVIVCDYVLEHVQNIELFEREISRVLRQ